MHGPRYLGYTIAVSTITGIWNGLMGEATAKKRIGHTIQFKREPYLRLRELSAKTLAPIQGLVNRAVEEYLERVDPIQKGTEKA